MTTSHSTLVLSKPAGNDPIPEVSLSYLRTRNRLKAFKLIQSAFELAGITQASLAARLRRDPGQLSRTLNAPGNWTLDTISDLLFAISGGVPDYDVDFPLDKPKKNSTQPGWALDFPVTETRGTAEQVIQVVNPLSDKSAPTASPTNGRI